jgi:FkbM family methyltransferase
MPDQIWIDVGAHFGEKTFAKAEQDHAIRVYAFEPNLQLAAQLMGRLLNYTVLPMAVSETNGCADFHVNGFDAASSLLPFVPEGLARWEGGGVLMQETVIPVPTIRLDTFLNTFGIKEVTFLKVDAQGSDLAVIRSAGERLRDIERISLEVQITAIPLYRGASRKEDVLTFLRGAGFRLVGTEPQSFGQEENLDFVRA